MDEVVGIGKSRGIGQPEGQSYVICTMVGRVFAPKWERGGGEWEGCEWVFRRFVSGGVLRVENF